MVNFFNLFKPFKGIDKFFLILILLIPSSLISGALLPDVFVVVLSLGFIYKVVNLNKKNFLFNRYTIFFLLFWLYVSLRSFWADDLYFSLKSALPYIRFFIFSLMMLYFFEEYKEKFIYLLLFSIVLPIIFVFFDTAYQYIFSQDIFGFPKLDHRLSGPFGTELIVGSYLARLSPMIIICYYIIYKELPLKILYFFSIISPLIFLTGERTSFFLFNFFLFFLFIFVVKKNKLRNFFLVYFCIIFFLSIFLLSSNKLRDRMIYIPACEMRINFLMNDTCINSLKDKEIKQQEKTTGHFIFSEAHEGHFKTALNIFLDNKFFGVGAKMFRVKCSDAKYYYKFGCTTHPHNLLMQILAETGLVGLLFLIIAISYIFIKAFRIGLVILGNNAKSSEIVQFLLLIMMAQSFLIFLPAGQFFNNWNALLIYFPLGIYLKYIYKNN
jgi:hypothetical protein